MPDGGFKVTADESEFLTLIMWEAAANFSFSDDNLVVILEKDVELQFKNKEDYEYFKQVHETNAPNNSAFQEIFKEMVARPSLIDLKNRPPSLKFYNVFKRKATFLRIQEERAEWTEHLLSMEKVWEG